jgi:S1-C subfamily serine protease
MLFALAMLCALAVPAASQPGAAARPPGYFDAERAFFGLSIEGRIKLQVILAAAGYWNAVPNVDFSKRLFDSIVRFQNENGYAPNGSLDEKQFERLFDLAGSKLALWGLREVAHPERGRPIWVPMGLGLRGERTRNGLSFREPQDRLRMAYNYFPNTDLQAAFAHLVNKFQGEGTQIHYKVLRPDFFAISSTTSAGVDGYMRYHEDGSGILGFTMFWDNSKGVVGGERVAVLTSGSLWAIMTGAAFAAPPVLNRPMVEVGRPAPVAAPPAASAPAAPSAPAPTSPGGKPSFSSGTGFFVNRDGYVLTNDHVVGECSAVAVVPDRGEPTIGRVVARDQANDLAILKTDIKPAKVAAFRIGSRLGEPIAVFGYPLSDVLASSGNFTLGNVTATAGLRDDSRFVQVSAPVQSGNSGGPLLDHNGNYVGVVTAKLNALKVVAVAGDLPQNVNFAIKSSVAANFLDTNRIAFEAGSATAAMTPADLADHAKAVSTFVLCKS